MDSQLHIDALLERYLALLDRYTRLRSELSTLQTAMFQSIARANFAAERGMRYGPDFYDERMQALRRLDITMSMSAPVETGPEVGSQLPVFEVIEAGDGSAGDGPASKDEDAPGLPEVTEVDESDEKKEDNEAKKQQKLKDPLRWFGLVMPMALRQAQSQAIESVEKVIPRLASVSAEMAGIEIQVRRARKKRAKASAEAVEKGQS